MKKRLGWNKIAALVLFVVLVVLVVSVVSVVETITAEPNVLHIKSV